VTSLGPFVAYERPVEASHPVGPLGCKLRFDRVISGLRYQHAPPRRKVSGGGGRPSGQLQNRKMPSKNLEKHRVRKTPVFVLRPQRGPKSSPSQERRAGACRKNFDTDCFVPGWLCCCPLHPPPSLFLPTLPVPCSDRKSPFLVPSLHSRNYWSARSLSKRASWRGTGRFFALSCAD
jgi:hypothetical protein